MNTNSLKSIFKPELYHGWKKDKQFFEGWYYKLVSENGKHQLAIIAGVSMNDLGKKYAFIQLFDGTKLKSTYIRYPFEQFKTSSKELEVSINTNRFTLNTVELNTTEWKGKLTFSNGQPLKNYWYAPGVMGIFSFFPKMECYHGVLNLGGKVAEKLRCKDEDFDFTAGSVYIEKDWGHSFPEAYIWCQCNNFTEQNTNLSLSIAQVKYLGIKTIGFFCIAKFNEKMYRFSTQNFSKIDQIRLNKNNLKLVFTSRKYELIVHVKEGKYAKLKAPRKGEMQQHIKESLTANIDFTLIEKKSNQILFQSQGVNGGLDLSNPELLTYLISK